MPIYEYECTKCGKIEEALQKFSDKPLTKCKSCSGKLTKLVSQSTFHLKGSGWYVTDYAAKSRDSSKPSEKTKEFKAGDAKSSGSGSASTKTPPDKSA
jgi:putative FmdB family regulatory protein